MCRWGRGTSAWVGDANVAALRETMTAGPRHTRLRAFDQTALQRRRARVVFGFARCGCSTAGDQGQAKAPAWPAAIPRSRDARGAPRRSSRAPVAGRRGVRRVNVSGALACRVGVMAARRAPKAKERHGGTARLSAAERGNTAIPRVPGTSGRRCWPGRRPRCLRVRCLNAFVSLTRHTARGGSSGAPSLRPP